MCTCNTFLILKNITSNLQENLQLIHIQDIVVGFIFFLDIGYNNGWNMLSFKILKLSD